MPDELEIKIVTTADAKGAQDAKRAISDVVDTAKKGAREAEAETKKWSLSKKSLIDNVKILKTELSGLPYVGQIFSVLRNPVVLLGAGIAMVTAKAKELHEATKELLKPIDNVFGPRPIRNVEQFASYLVQAGNAAKTVLQEVNGELERTLNLLAAQQGKGKMPMKGEREALVAAQKRFQGIAETAGAEIGLGGKDVFGAVGEARQAEQALALLVNRTRTEQHTRSILQAAAAGTLAPYQVPGPEKAMVQQFMTANPAEQYSFAEAAGMVAAQLPSEQARQAQIRMAQARSIAAGKRLGALAPEVAAGKMSAQEFVQRRAGLAQARRADALGQVESLQGRIELLDVNRRRAFEEAYQYEWGGAEFNPPSTAAARSAAAAQARSNWSRAYATGEAAGPLGMERGRLGAEQSVLSAQLARLLAAQMAGDNSVTNAIARLIQQNNELRERLRALENQMKNGELR